jgi:hypothetical protein
VEPMPVEREGKRGERDLRVYSGAEPEQYI